jgi:hypothetical protein
MWTPLQLEMLGEVKADASRIPEAAWTPLPALASPSLP